MGEILTEGSGYDGWSITTKQFNKLLDEGIVTLSMSSRASRHAAKRAAMPWRGLLAAHFLTSRRSALEEPNGRRTSLLYTRHWRAIAGKHAVDISNMSLNVDGSKLRPIKRRYGDVY